MKKASDNILVLLGKLAVQIVLLLVLVTIIVFGSYGMIRFLFFQ